MSVVAVVQARMGSTRLPGKVLADVGGVPMLEFMLRRVAGAPVDEVVVATSVLGRDDPVAEVAERTGAAVVRGSEQDVLDRFAAVLAHHPADTVVRLTGDCPLTDPDLVADALAAHRDTGADYTSNTLVRTFPDGLDVEVIEAEALLTAAEEATDPAEREHVTPYIYRRPERFRLAAFRAPRFLGDERWTVDSPADLEWVRGIVTELGATSMRWTDVAARFAPPPDQPTRGRRLLPATTSSPGARTWVLVDGADPHGDVSIEVRTGRATARLRVPEALRAETVELLRERLRADAQVTELQVLPPGPS